MEKISTAICHSCQRPMFACTCPPYQYGNTSLPVTSFASAQSVSMYATLTDANMEALRQMIREEIRAAFYDYAVLNGWIAFAPPKKDIPS